MYSIQGVTQAQRNLSHFLLPFPPSHPTHSHSPPRWTRTPTTPGTPQERTPWTAPVSLPGQPSGPTPAATCHQGEARGDDGNHIIISYKGNPYGSLHTYPDRGVCGQSHMYGDCTTIQLKHCKVVLCVLHMFEQNGVVSGSFMQNARLLLTHHTIQ